MTERPRAPGKRRRSNAHQGDDRPRGYEPMRMQRLWQDIDRSSDRLGLCRGQADENGAAWSWEAWLEWASSVIGGAGSQVTALPAHVWSALEQLPGAKTCQTVSYGALALARKLPVFGPLLAVVPGKPERDDESLR